jgi:dTDP-4-dehydrorhamnose reductase
MKHILVTGSKGQLGSAIDEVSKDYSGYQFTFVDIAELNLTDEEAVLTILEEESFDYCINCAAYTNVDQAEKEVELATLVNVDGARNLASACAKHNTFLIHISTDYVFNGRHHLPYRESDQPSPDSAYGRTKYEGEIAVMKNANQWIIIRTSWLYSTTGHNFVKTILRLSGEREELKVVDDQVGSPTYAGDLARAIMEIVGKLDDKTSRQVYHYSNEGVLSWYDFALTIVELADNSCRILPIESKDYPMLANRPHYSVLSKQKIKHTFGLEIPYWRDSLGKAINQLLKTNN